MATPPVLVLVLLLVPLVSAQSVRTQNGSLYFEIGGATLALTGSVSSAGSGQAGGTLVTQNDLAAAIANSVQQTQPQINNVYSTINSTEARLTTLVQGLVGGEQTRAEGIENALTISIAQEASRAISNERQISSAVAGAATATQLLSQSVATLLATDQSRLNTTLATLAAAFTGQLQTWQALINPQLSGIASTLSTVNTTLSTQIGTLSSTAVVETSRATSIQGLLSTAIGNEISRAVLTDNSLAVSASSLVFAEQTRASTVESALSSALGVERSRVTFLQANLSSAVATEVIRATTTENFLFTNTSSRIATALSTVPTKRLVWSTNVAGSYNLINIVDIARFTTGFPAVGVYSCVLRSENGAHWSGYIFYLSVSYYYCTSTYTPNAGGGHCNAIYNSFSASASPSGCGGSVFSSWSGTGAFTYAPGGCSQSISLICTSME